MKNSIKRAAMALLVVAITLVLALGIAEVALRTLIRPPQEYLMLSPGKRVFQPDARYVHGISGPAHYEVKPKGYRGRPFGADATEYRILLVGGSTTECTLLDVEEHWGTIVERALGRTSDGRSVWVGNVGRSGLTARDHAVTVKYVLRDFPRMDVVVVLVGVNDLTAALRQGANYERPPVITDAEAERRQIRNAFVISPEGFHKPILEGAAAVDVPWYKQTRLYELAQRARSASRARTVINAIGGSNLHQWRTHRQQASSILTQLPDLTAPLAEYRSNLTAIVNAARARGSDVVFLTQPNLWKKTITPAEERLLWLGGTGPFQDVPGQAYYSVPVLADAMTRYNEETLAVCRENNLKCFDLANAVPQDTTLLYDDVHFTEAGSALIGKLVSDHLRATRPELTTRALARP